MRPLIMEERNYSAELEPRLQHRSAEGRRRSAGSCHVRRILRGQGQGNVSVAYPLQFTPHPLHIFGVTTEIDLRHWHQQNMGP